MASANTHTYRTDLVWTGNLGSGTSNYRAYERAHEVSAPGVPVLLGSSDPAFRGDASRWNPELLLLAALSQCHMMAYLHLCAVNGVTVTGYTDQAAGTMVQTPDGGGHFTEAVLHPAVEVADAAMAEKAAALHADAHRLCFIANSVNFPVRHSPAVTVTASAP
ncbi:OsmC family protein [Streptomyces cocklensis]|jgi:organic hydroperoxide reductase OsmC/OhrA|uniref:Organic hydroperoxide reductase OsmC/OhrA n=1 Tax=Actinacidiphila cocklensis TaxID=887465 RepID=A0A9W4GQU7_9ACTN|nr:OsmC family protein [Actinacidiphila cocklensis]MDD1058009.1 OsmC family protein [Actinacidiphila cocklensis]WSX79544.1 OsmC family protein [Streptomyces sp. NBC_00899]CAG6393029.1 Organic hydroperoxide reductase OsmC/OhrA [Actinacidiphila cocklensis]